MVGTKLTPLRIVRSKLRKRQEASAAASRDVVAMQTVQTSSSLTQQGATVLWTYPVFGSDCQESIGVPLSVVQLDPTAVITTGAPKNGFCRGIPITVRKKFNKMLKRKPTPEIYTIPAELRHQLKQIYVY